MLTSSSLRSDHSHLGQATDRRHARARRRRAMLALAALPAFAAACGSGGTDEGDIAVRSASAEATTTTASAASTSSATGAARPTADVDELVDIGHGSLHVRCAGTGDATVLLVSGFTGSADDWPAIEPTLSAETRVCAYDRFGTGSSDAPPPAQTFRTEALDLRTLLDTIGEPGPYVVVGHSFGGPQAVEFAAAYPEDVAGLLLLDASPATWGGVICAVAEDPAAAGTGWVDACRTQAAPANNPEHLDGTAAFAEVAQITSLGSVPMVVATAPSRGATEGLPAPIVQHLNDAWNEGQADWASLSSSGELVVVPDTGHYIQADQPAFVLEALRGLLR